MKLWRAPIRLQSLHKLCRAGFVLLATFCILIAQPTIAVEPSTNLTVLADEILMLPLTHIARDYARDRGVTVTVVVIDGNDAAQQIGQGLDASLLITANTSLLDTLNERGLIDAFNKHSIAATQIALAAPIDIARSSNLAKHISLSAILLAQPDLPLLVMPESSLEGTQTQLLIANADYANTLHSRIITVESREAMIKKLSQSSGFGVLFAADILQEPSLKLLTLLPTNSGGSVNFQAVLVANEMMEPARELLRYLQSPAVQQILINNGFQIPTTK